MAHSAGIITAESRVRTNCFARRKRRKMDIQIEPHTLERAEERGSNEEEIRDVINTGTFIAARYSRLSKTKIFEFKEKRQGRYYDQKKVEVYYAVEGDIIVTVTVYVYYGRWD
jgi:hypothetical protein